MQAHVFNSSGDEPASAVVTDMLESIGVVSVSYARHLFSEPRRFELATGRLAGFHVVRRGSARLALDADDPPALLSPGDVCLLPHGHDHVIVPEDGEVEIVSVTFQFDDRANHPLLAVLPAKVLLSGDDGRPARALEPTLDFMRWELDASRPGSDAVLTRLAGVLVIQIVRSFLASSPATGPSWRRALREPSIGAALGIIHENPSSDFTVENLATRVGMSRSTFAGRFAELVGEPPLHYVTRLRMQRARALLRESNATLAEVAARAGYDSEAAFSKAFKRWVGVAPGTYRRHAKKPREPLRIGA